MSAIERKRKERETHGKYEGEVRGRERRVLGWVGSGWFGLGWVGSGRVGQVSAAAFDCK